MAVFRRMVSEPAAQRRPADPSDWTEAQWALLAPRLRDRDPAGPGRPTPVDTRELLRARRYLQPTDGPWRYLPHDLPPRATVHDSLATWTAEGTWAAAMQVLREGSRRHARRHSRPTAGILDSPTSKAVGTKHESGWEGAQ